MSDETTKGTAFIQQIVTKHSKVSSFIHELQYEFPFINTHQCYDIVQGLLQHNTALRLHDDHDEMEHQSNQISRKSLDDIQDEYFMHFKHPPHHINHIFNYCQLKMYEWKYFEIKAWWRHKPQPKEWWDRLETDPETDTKQRARSTQSTTNAKPLSQFTVHDMVRTITNWVQNDVNYTKHRSQTMKIFSNHQLAGDKMIILSGDDAKRIVKDEVLEFMTLNTLNIMFDGFNKWKERARAAEKPEALKSKSAEDIALSLFEYPLQQLTTRIETEYIDGQTFIDSVDKTNIIQQETGWKEDDIAQIHLVLFQAMVLNNHAFKHKMRNVLTNSDDRGVANVVMERITEIMNEYGVEQLQYDMKRNRDTQRFNDQIMTIIDDELVSQVDGILIDEGSLIQQVYNRIARCLAFKYDDKALVNDDLDLEDARDWICSNCGNYNFSKYVDGKINHNLKWCTLCGITQVDSVTMKIRNEDTFIMVHNDNNIIKPHAEMDDDYEKSIQEVISFNKLSLLCPNQSDKSKCVAMVRLAKELMRYNEYLKSLDSDKSNIKSTMPMQVDIAQFIDNDAFKLVYEETIQSITRFKGKEQPLFLKMFDDNMDGIADIKTFLETDCKSFKQKTKLHLSLKPGYGTIVWKRINAALKQKAQKLQFGEYLSNLNINAVDRDYHHILKTHIHNGNKHNITNVFRFFGSVIHYRDTHKVIAKCRSVQRKADRANEAHVFDGKEVTKDKNIWTLKQYYNQTQLDIIHSYLVHSKSKEDIEEEEEHHEDLKEEVANKDRYISFGAEYGFGVMHEHHDLAPVHSSVYDEMMQHKECPLRELVFHNLLTKAIMKHKIALSEEYVAQFVCKYYNKQYRIIRNEPIGIRHILAIVAYTDMTTFCTAFRKTYRRISEDETDEQVTKRHIQLYHYSRGLFEAIEFFGSNMDDKLIVYHGLNKVLCFKRFTAYFNQPISCTTSFRSAQQFSAGSGIILTLISGAKQLNKKYLSVSWLSTFPDEDERLFYGAFVVFKIHNIHNTPNETKQLTSHADELWMLNQFQRAIQNEDVVWNENNLMYDTLAQLIEMRSMRNQMYAIHKHKRIMSDYGESLFEYFCDHITWICIRNFTTSFPSNLFRVMFENDEEELSLMRILALFPLLKEIVFKIDLDQMIGDGRDYIQMVSEHVLYNDIDGFSGLSGQHLKRISFKSERREYVKQIQKLQRLENIHAHDFKKWKWSLEYQFAIDNRHKLIFTNDIIEGAEKIKALKHNLDELQRAQKEMEREKEIHQKEWQQKAIKMQEELKEKEALICAQRQQFDEEVAAELKEKEEQILKLQKRNTEQEEMLAAHDKISHSAEPQHKGHIHKQRSKTFHSEEFVRHKKRKSKKKKAARTRSRSNKRHKKVSIISERREAKWTQISEDNAKRRQMMKEKTKLKGFKKKLKKDQKRVSRQSDELIKAQREWERKIKDVDKLKKSLESERKAMKKEKQKVSDMEEHMLHQRKQRKAEFQRQRTEIERQKKSLGRQSPRSYSNTDQRENMLQQMQLIVEEHQSTNKRRRKKKHRKRAETPTPASTFD
eukprot:34798_1